MSTKISLQLADFDFKILKQLEVIKKAIGESGNLKRELKKVIIKACSDITDLNKAKTTEINKVKVTPETPTYSQIVAKNREKVIEKTVHKTKHVLKVTPKDSEVNSNDLKQTIKNKINPRSIKVGINKMHKISNNGILIEVTTEGDLRRMKEAIEQNLQSEATVTIPDKKRPKVIIHGIDSNETSEEVIKTIQEQIGCQDTDLKFMFFKGRGDTKSCVIDLTPKVKNDLLVKGHIHIGYFRCSVRDFTLVIRCFKCLGLGHTKKYCQRSCQSCSHCGGDHLYNQCRSTNEKSKCINCIRHNDKINNRRQSHGHHHSQGSIQPHNTEHNAMDNMCEVYRKFKEIVISKTQHD
jgi:translation elongation factor EF-1beta